MTTQIDSTHARRPRRRSSAALKLQKRDLWILEGLAKMRFLTTSHIARLYFGGARSITNRRLRRLRQARYVRAFSRGLNTDMIFSLLPAGSDALGEIVRSDAAPRCPRRLDGQIDHLLAINTVRIALAATLIGGSLHDWQSDWELRRYASADTVPDARFKISWPEIGERSFALEVEYHTRSPRRFLSKMLRYAATRTGSLSSVDDTTVLVVGRHPVWLERYLRAMASLSDRHAVWFTTLTELERSGADGAIWRTCWTDQTVSLGALANCPHRDGSSRAKNAAAARLTGNGEPHIHPSGSVEFMTDDRNQVNPR